MKESVHCCYLPAFILKWDFFNGLYYSIFHSISAFCNAGFDIMGKYKPYSSFTAYYDDPIVSFTLSALILIGGIGFIVWSDIIDHKWHFKKYALQTKMVLSFFGSSGIWRSFTVLFAGTK